MRNESVSTIGEKGEREGTSSTASKLNVEKREQKCEQRPHPDAKRSIVRVRPAACLDVICGWAITPAAPPVVQSLTLSATEIDLQTPQIDDIRFAREAPSTSSGQRRMRARSCARARSLRKRNQRRAEKSGIRGRASSCARRCCADRLQRRRARRGKKRRRAPQETAQREGTGRARGERQRPRREQQPAAGQRVRSKLMRVLGSVHAHRGPCTTSPRSRRRPAQPSSQYYNGVARACGWWRRR